MKIDLQTAMMKTAAPTKPQQPAVTEEEQRLREKCREFEAILLQKMVEAMQTDTNLFGQGVQGEFFGGMFAEIIAKELAEDPGLGLAENIIRSLREQNS
ncbi:MAG: hypothetical protein GX770_02545 [Firmicutes bacterium]|nr:hypothetical protein [Bacillota bacterium]